MNLLAALVAILSAFGHGAPVTNPNATTGNVPPAIDRTMAITPTISSEIDISGTIQSITTTVGVTGTTQIVVNGTTIVITGTTEIKGNLIVGHQVQIEGTVLPNGTIVATEIKPGKGIGNDPDDKEKESEHNPNVNGNHQQGPGDDSKDKSKDSKSDDDKNTSSSSNNSNANTGGQKGSGADKGSSDHGGGDDHHGSGSQSTGKHDGNEGKKGH